ncbi:hypothetical protein [Psychroserpens damuponensis]|uniref:hypothetical protein n=1 Tax=Psychroserpens damuponensis TaxID=943936 RepID=UPI00058D6F44|nr:hypothetical protein [Psychroserpens damuponensis]
MFNFKYLIVILLLLSGFQDTTPNICYHSIYTGPNDQRPIVVDLWFSNIGKKLIKETKDSKNRVIQLEFLRDGTYSSFGNFPIAKVTYTYVENTIIETSYDKHGNTIYVDKFGAHYQSIYHLDDNGLIVKAERIYDFDTKDPVWKQLHMKPPTKADLKTEARDYFTEYYANKPLEVEFYKYSYYKLNGVYPVSKDYQLESDYKTKYLDYLIEEGIAIGVHKLLKTTHN